MTLNASTYAAMDKVEGLKLVDNAAIAGFQLDATKSDDIGLSGGAVFTKFTTAQTDLDLALKDAAAVTTSDNLVFQLGGNTYIYQDVGGALGAANNVLDAGDTLVQLVGTVDLDLLVAALA